MKKVMLILMLCMCLAGCKKEPDGIVFVNNTFEGEAFYGDSDSVDAIVKTAEGNIAIGEGTGNDTTHGFACDWATGAIVFSTEPPKPYLHKNPNNGNWVCSKHGDLTTKPIGIYSLVEFDGEGIKYCATCYFEVMHNYINQHITGVKEND